MIDRPVAFLPAELVEGEELVERRKGGGDLHERGRGPVGPERTEGRPSACVRSHADAARFVGFYGKAVRRPPGRSRHFRRPAEDVGEPLRRPAERREDLARIHPRQPVVPVDVVPGVDAALVPRRGHLAHPEDGVLARADVGRRQERSVEHRPDSVGRGRRGAHHLLHEAAPEDALHRLPGRVGSEREEKRGARAVAGEEVEEAGNPLDRPSKRVDVDLQGEARRQDATPRASSARRGRSRASSSGPSGNRSTASSRDTPSPCGSTGHAS